jgi:hypothetical protein
LIEAASARLYDRTAGCKKLFGTCCQGYRLFELFPCVSLFWFKHSSDSGSIAQK